jgi:hypothetical protein
MENEKLISLFVIQKEFVNRFGLEKRN